jgi:thiamine-monophosphate kinase
VNKETFFISLFANKKEVIGDDGAVIGQMVYSNDAFCENVHFRRSWMRLEQIAYKAMLVNISDAIAMNAVPRYALLSVAIPRGFTTHQMHELSEGFQKAAAAYGVEIIGGDTIADVKLDISVTIIGETDRPLQRRGLKKGHLLAYTGKVGDSAKQLRYLINGGRVHSKSKFVMFPLRGVFIKEATPSLSCGMDISDGIGSDLERLSRLNRVGFRFTKRLGKALLCSGEEYEMLVGFDPRKRKRLMMLAKKHRIPLTVFAEAVRKPYRNSCKAHHF